MAQLDIWNQALTLARARGRLSSITDPSPEQEVLAQAWPFVLKTVQAAAWWPGCRAQARLALIVERDDNDWTESQPEYGWQFAYAPPANMLRPWHLADYSRFSFSYNTNRDRMLISSNTEQAILTYAVLQEDPTLWTAQQEDATVHALAALITGPLTGKNSLAKNNFDIANLRLTEAQAGAANDLGAEPKPNVPWLQARGYNRVEHTRYYYPMGELFAYAN